MTNVSIKKRFLGKTDLYVSEIGLGCWHLGGKVTINRIPTTYGNVSEKTAKNIIKSALRLGVNVFDTADSYSLGNSECRLGEVLKKNEKELRYLQKLETYPHMVKQIQWK